MSSIVTSADAQAMREGRLSLDQVGVIAARAADGNDDQRPPMPTTIDAFLQLVHDGWDVEVARRSHGQHTTEAVHLDIHDKIGVGRATRTISRRIYVLRYLRGDWPHRAQAKVDARRHPSRTGTPAHRL